MSDERGTSYRELRRFLKGAMIGDMNSYRARVAIGDLRPGVKASDVLPAFAAAIGRTCVVEHQEVIIDKGAPCAQVRFLAETEDEARACLDSAHEILLDLAVIPAATLLRRAKTRWISV